MTRSRRRILVAALVALSVGTQLTSCSGNKKPEQPTGRAGCDGTFHIEPSPNVGSKTNLLNAIYAVSPQEAWAVGWYNTGNTGSPTDRHPLILRWDGSDWSLADNPELDNKRGYLSGVWAAGSGDIWAAGVLMGSQDQQSTLIEHWDGSRWSVAATDTVQSQPSTLIAVTGLSSEDVWAVGYAGPEGQRQTLLQHFDGHRWTVSNTTDTGAAGGGATDIELNGVLALAKDDVWAVGTITEAGGHQRTLTERWDGSRWSRVPSPNYGSGNNRLYDVSGVASNDVWAVGLAFTQGLSRRTMALHWDGQEWKLVPTPNPQPEANSLRGVSSISSSIAWAAGSQFPGGVQQTLAAKWDGSKWTTISTEDTGRLDGFSDISVTSEGDVWAVGATQQGQFRNLVEHYC